MRLLIGVLMPVATVSFTTTNSGHASKHRRGVLEESRDESSASAEADAAPRDDGLWMVRDFFDRPGLLEAQRLLSEHSLTDAKKKEPLFTKWIGRLFAREDEDDELVLPRRAPLDEAEVFQMAWRDVQSVVASGSKTVRQATALLARWATTCSAESGTLLDDDDRVEEEEHRRDSIAYRIERGIAIAKYIGRTPFGGDNAVVAAALLCEAHENGMSLELVEEHLGKDAAALVRSLSNLEQLSKLQRARWDAEGAAIWEYRVDDDDDERGIAEYDDDHLLRTCRLPATHADNLRHMLVAVAGDFRALPLLLARRLEALHEECASARNREAPPTQSSLARDALDVYAPLAERLGLYALKNDLEDAAFERLAPATRRRIVDALDATRDERATVLQDVSTGLRRLLLEDDVLMNSVESLRVSTREKEPYSVWRKQRKLRAKRARMSEEYLEPLSSGGGRDGTDDDARPPVLYPLDTIAFRIVLEPRGASDEKDAEALAEDGENLCYRALSLVHSTWAVLPNRTKDYVASPKKNGYQSLHTTVMMRLHGTSYPFEVQIRTVDMHRVAEFGSAAHVLYSRGGPHHHHQATSDDYEEEDAAPSSPHLVKSRPASTKRHLVSRAGPGHHRRVRRGAHPSPKTKIIGHKDHKTRSSFSKNFDDDHRRGGPLDLDEPFSVKVQGGGVGDAAHTAAVIGKTLGERLRAERVFILASGGRVLNVKSRRSNAVDAVDALIKDVEADASGNTSQQAALDKLRRKSSGPIEINGRRVEWLDTLSTKLINGDEIRWVEDKKKSEEEFR